MSKMKTRRAAAKRFAFTGTGKIKRRQANHRHLFTGKDRKEKRQQRETRIVSAADAGLIRKMLPYG